MNCKHLAVLACLLCMIFGGCSTKHTVDSTVDFYYIEAGSQQNSLTESIVTETRDTHGQSSNIEQILKYYLSGPESEKNRSPFPEGTELLSVSVSDEIAQIVLSKDFAQLTGSDLTLACACICLTIQEISACPRVEISAMDSLLDGQSIIAMDANAIDAHDMIR